MAVNLCLGATEVNPWRPDAAAGSSRRFSGFQTMDAVCILLNNASSCPSFGSSKSQPHALPVTADARELARSRFDDVVSWRRQLHSNPELSWEEAETAAFIRKQLGQFTGIEVSQPTPTSVVGRLRGGAPGRVLALRADVDALPLTEESGVTYSSRREGVMHACGHDAHTAQLLATASILSAYASSCRERWYSSSSTPRSRRPEAPASWWRRV